VKDGNSQRINEVRRFNDVTGFIPLLRGSKTLTSKLKKIETFRWGITCP
jgi:hypothetical protein